MNLLFYDFGDRGDYQGIYQDVTRTFATKPLAPTRKTSHNRLTVRRFSYGAAR